MAERIEDEQFKIVGASLAMWHKLSEVQPEEGQVCIFLRDTYSAVYGVVSYKQTLREAMVKSYCRGAWTPLARYTWWSPAPVIPGPEVTVVDERRH